MGFNSRGRGWRGLFPEPTLNELSYELDRVYCGLWILNLVLA